MRLASFDGDEAGEPIAVTSGPAAEFHSHAAVDSSDRVWIAYDTALMNWGKDFSTSSAAEGSEGLHLRRGLGLRVYANDRVFEPDAAIGEILTGRMGRFAEVPAIAFDGAGSAWVVFRHWTIRKPHEMYHVYGTRLGEDGWTTPVMMTNSSGRNTQRTAVATAPDGTIHLAFASDLRSPENLPTPQMHALRYNVFLASLEQTAPFEATLSEVEVPVPQQGFKHRTRVRMTVDGKTYSLLLGDCRRHADVRGHTAVDGSIEDT